MVLITLVAILCLAILLALYLWKRRLESYVKDLPGSDSTYPLIGNAHEFIGKTTVEIFNNIYTFMKTKGTPNKIWLGPILVVSLDRPEDVKTILMSPNCLEKPYLYRFLPAELSILTMKCK